MKLKLDRYAMSDQHPLLAMRPIVLDKARRVIRIFRTDAIVSYTKALSSPCPTREHKHATAGHCGVKMIVSYSWAKTWNAKKVKVTTKIPAIGLFQVFGHVEYGQNVLWCDAALLWGIVQPSWFEESINDMVTYKWKDPFSDYRMRFGSYELSTALGAIRNCWDYHNNDLKLLEE